MPQIQPLDEFQKTKIQMILSYDKDFLSHAMTVDTF
jgi:hypothetical protein